MGLAAAEKADLVILTSDNPRSEEPQKIIDEIAAGIPAGTSFETEPDRAQALRRAVAVARPGDVVLIAGKGHENYQIDRSGIHPFDEREIVAEYMRKNSGKAPDEGCVGAPDIGG